jgi:hypothetical protein
MVGMASAAHIDLAQGVACHFLQEENASKFKPCLKSTRLGGMMKLKVCNPPSLLQKYFLIKGLNLQKKKASSPFLW